MKNYIRIIVVLQIILCACQKEEFLISDKHKDSEEKKTDLKFGTKSKEVKTLIAKNWGKVANLKPRHSHTSLVFDDKMWIIGGKGDSDIPENDVWYSNNGSNWEAANKKASFPARRGHASAVFQNKLWITGGLVSGPFNVLDDVWWSSNGKEWNQVSNTNFPPVVEHTLTVFNGALWLIGGYILDPVTNFATISPAIWRSYDGVKWSKVIENAPFQGRARHTTVAHDGKLWLVGGRYGEGPPNHGINNDVWFTHDGKKWELATAKADFPTVSDHTLVSDGDKMWLAGGMHDTMDQIWYSTCGESWLQADVTKKFPGRADHSSVMFDGKLWIINGYADYPSSQKHLSDIWSFEESNTIDDITSKSN